MEILIEENYLEKVLLSLKAESYSVLHSCDSAVTQ